MRIKLGIVVAVIVLAMAVLACGSGDSGGESSIGSSTFKNVCKGEGVEDTAYYGSSDGISPLKIFKRQDPDQTYYLIFAPQTGGFPKEWNTADPELTELVVCLTVLDRELVKECHYTKDEESNEIELTEELYSSTYEAVLRNAITAEEYAKTEFFVESSGECVEYTVDFTEMETRILDADPGAELVEFLTPWVVPEPE